MESLTDFGDVRWEDCPEQWHAPFRPAGEGEYFRWPLLTDLMPWQQSGIKAGRTWVIECEEEVLAKRWRLLVGAPREGRRGLFKDSPTGRKVDEAAVQLPPSDVQLPSIDSLQGSAAVPPITRIAFRSFDRQFVFADARVLDRPGPALWRTHGVQQVYLTTLLNHEIGKGPAATACSFIPDLHHFRGSFGAKEVFPLYRSEDAKEPNIAHALLDHLRALYRREVTPDDFLAYIYGVIAHPGYTASFFKELKTRELRVPITKNAMLFEEARAEGAHLLWLHTYGERFIPSGHVRGRIPPGLAKCIRAVAGQGDAAFRYNPDTNSLAVESGEFAPVDREVYEFEVSGFKVVQSWLRKRLRRGAGKSSSPLDEIRPVRWTGPFTTELLELLWVVEATLGRYERQREVLGAIVEADCLLANALPAVPDVMRKAPKGDKRSGRLV